MRRRGGGGGRRVHEVDAVREALRLRSRVGDVAALVELLGHVHGVLGGHVQGLGRRLLQLDRDQGVGAPRGKGEDEDEDGMRWKKDHLEVGLVSMLVTTAVGCSMHISKRTATES